MSAVVLVLLGGQQTGTVMMGSDAAVSTGVARRDVDRLRHTKELLSAEPSSQFVTRCARESHDEKARLAPLSPIDLCTSPEQRLGLAASRGRQQANVVGKGFAELPLINIERAPLNRGR